MAGYSLRSLSELGTQARGFFTESIPGAIAALRPNTFTVIGKVLALLGFENELRRSWLVRQMFASTADDVWLDRHGFELGINRGGAIAASGTIILVAARGTTVPAGMVWSRPDGATFTSLANAKSTDGSVSLPIQANETGPLGDTGAGTILTLDPSWYGFGYATTAEVDPQGITGGAEYETLESYRSRVLDRKRRPPQGGSAPDYESWVREALGSLVDRVFVDSFVNETRNVWVAFTVTNTPDGLPTVAQLAIVQAYINDPVRRPMQARAYAVGLTPLPIPVRIGGLSPDTTDTRISVETELAAEFQDRAEPGRPAAASIVSRSWISQAISRAVGEDRHRLELPAADPVIPAGYWPVLGPVTYTD